MSDDFLDDEEQIAAEQDRDDLFDQKALQRPIRELPELQPVVMLSPQASVREAINRMIEKRVGCVLITSEGKLVGVFSERDVLRKVATADINIDATPVSELMTRNPQTLRMDSPLVFALNQMTVGGYRHIPLMDGHQQPVAVIAMRDIVAYIVSLYPDEVLKIPDDPNQANTSSREGA